MASVAAIIRLVFHHAPEALSQTAARLTGRTDRPTPL
jgi:hypothetical protein